MESKLIKSKRCVRFDLKLAEIGCIKSNLLHYSNTIRLYGNEVSGLEPWEADIVHRLTNEFRSAEEQLYAYQNLKAAE